MKNILLKAVLIIVLILVLLPFAGILTQSLLLKNWSSILTSWRTYGAIKNTALIALIALLINIVLGTPVASLLAKESFRGKKILESLVFLPLVIPGFVTTMGIQFLFIKLELIETLIGVGIVHSLVTFPYYIRALKAGYSTISSDYEKMGRLMGAGSLEIFFKINFPMLLPAFLAGVSLVIIVSFAQYLVTLIIGGGEIITLPILMFPFISGGDIRVGAVYSIIYIFINIILILLLEKGVLTLYSNKKPGENSDRD
ncbi:MAG: ABC transporter permease [Fusobacteriaceae bacterium]